MYGVEHCWTVDSIQVFTNKYFTCRDDITGYEDENEFTMYKIDVHIYGTATVEATR